MAVVGLLGEQASACLVDGMFKGTVKSSEAP
jgi:hypothetical protein